MLLLVFSFLSFSWEFTKILTYQSRFFSRTQVEQIDLRSNQLTFLPASLSKLRNLKQLDASEIMAWVCLFLKEGRGGQDLSQCELQPPVPSAAFEEVLAPTQRWQRIVALIQPFHRQSVCVSTNTGRSWPHLATWGGGCYQQEQNSGRTHRLSVSAKVVTWSVSSEHRSAANCTHRVGSDNTPAIPVLAGWPNRCTA